MISPATVSALLAAAALTATSVEGHAYMTLPLPTWPVSYGTNSPSGLIEGATVLPVPSGMSYTTDPLSNTKAYWTAFNASKYTSLKELADDTQELQTMSTFGTATKECGFSLVNGTARDLPQYVEWTQLTPSHQGPCEVWCDDTRVFEDWNCAADYTTSPAMLPYDASKCKGAARLTSIWLALHALPWQVYTNCAPLTGSVSSSADASSTGSVGSSTTSSSTTSAPTTTTAAPASTTAAPTTTTATPTTTTASGSDDDTEDESSDSSVGNEAESSDDDTNESPSTTAPTATSSKCSVRSRRRE